MKCTKCTRKMVKRRNYSPTEGYTGGYTWTHVYSLSEALTNKNICTHIVEVSE